MDYGAFCHAWDANPHGVGFAGKREQKIWFKKGFMDKEEAYKYHDSLELPFVTHFRKSSIGITCPELTHPFIISKDSPLDLEGECDKVLFMNGTIHLWDNYLNATGVYPKKDEVWSDARGIASIISNNNEMFLGVLAAKFVVLYKDRDNFFYYGDFTKDDGIYYSNLTYKPVIETMVNQWGYGKIHELKKNSITTYFPKKNGGNCGTNDKKIWEEDFNEKEMALRYLLNRLTERAATNLWKTYKKKDNLEWAYNQGLKVLKQQRPELNYEKIHKIIKHKSGLFPDYEPELNHVPDNVYDYYCG